METKFKIGDAVAFQEWYEGTVTTRHGRIREIWYDEYSIVEFGTTGYYFKRQADQIKLLPDSEAMLYTLESLDGA